MNGSTDNQAGQKIEALSPVTNVDHLGLGRMERQLQTSQDDLGSPESFTRSRLRPAQQDGIIRVADQLPHLSAAVFPEPIQLVKDHVCQYS
jgi:hypothetical protein